MKFKTIILLFAGLLFINCSKNDDPKLSSENIIISFKLTENGQIYNGIINHSLKVIDITVNNLDLSNPITPVIEISNNATISPSASTAQNFNQSIQYTVKAENGDNAIYTVNVSSSDNKITSFKISPNDTFLGNINHTNRTITIETIGLELNSTLAPEIEISTNSTISPNPTIAQDFSQYVEYTVTAQNGEQATYTINTNNIPFSNEKKILSFQFDIDGEIFEGVIDHSNLTIAIDTYKNPSNISPIITLSENASISPSGNDFQNFLNDIEYTVTAEDLTTNIYTVKTKWISINTVNSANNTGDVATNYYNNATPFVRTSFVDLTLPNSKIILENNDNRYELFFFNYNTHVYNDILYTSFQIEFPVSIVTATDYKLKYEINDVVKSETTFFIDVLAENSPDIISANQSSYNYNDTLILTGNNLLPGLRIAAHNASIYQYNQSYVSVNTDGTILTFPITVNHNMFPSWLGQPSPYATPVIIYYNGRYGETIIVDFN